MTETDSVAAHAEAIEVEYRARSVEEFITFASGLTIPSASGPQLFKSCMAGFQRDCFSLLSPSLDAVRRGEMPPVRRFWVERTKKASKDADLAVCLLWLLSFPHRPLYMQVGAADRDQAAIIRRRMGDLLHHNPWLGELVDLQRYSACNREGLAQLDILAADVAGSHGETPDVLIINELSHVTKWEFIENLLDNADGVPQGLVIIATNAGFRGTRAEVWRKNAEGSDHWQMLVWSKPAPWHDKGILEDAKRRNPTSRFNRLWRGMWVSGKGDTLNEDDINRCFPRGLGPLREPQKRGWSYIMGLDLGVSHDHAGIVCLGVQEKRQILQLAQMRAWEPNARTGEVDLMDVENAVFAMARLFRVGWVGYDPSQAKLMAQRLIRRGVPMREMPFTGSNLTTMAERFVQVVEAGRLRCYDDPDGRMRRDFGKFYIVEKSYGYRLEAVSDEYGHADVGTALVICMPRAVDMMEGRLGLREEDDLVSSDDSPLTDEEIQALPEELKSVVEVYDKMHKQQEAAAVNGFGLFADW